MPRAAWLFDNLITTIEAGTIATNAELGSANVLTDRPREVFDHKPGNGYQSDADRKWVEVDIGAGNVSASISAGIYDGAAYAAAIEAALITLDATFTCHFSGSGFHIQRGAGNFSIPTKTGTHGADNSDDAVWEEIGFDKTADLSGSNSYGGTLSYGSHTWIRFRNDSSPLANPDVCAVMLFGNSKTDFSDVKVYAHSTNISPSTRYRLENTAAFSATLSTRPTDQTNVIQVADVTGTGATLYPYWWISWEHHDLSDTHQIGLVRFLDPVQSSTRTIRVLGGHGKRDLGEALSTKNYYPAHRAKFWATPLAFEMWNLADWRTVGHKIAAWGRGRGYLWFLNYNDWLNGDVTADGEADKGYLFWGASQSIPEDDYDGESAGAVSADYDIEQIR